MARKDETTPPPDELLVEAIGKYEQYLEIAEISRIPAADDVADEAPEPAPLGLIVWDS